MPKWIIGNKKSCYLFAQSFYSNFLEINVESNLWQISLHFSSASKVLINIWAQVELLTVKELDACPHLSLGKWLIKESPSTHCTLGWKWKETSIKIRQNIMHHKLKKTPKMQKFLTEMLQIMSKVQWKLEQFIRIFYQDLTWCSRWEKCKKKNFFFFSHNSCL